MSDDALRPGAELESPFLDEEVRAVPRASDDEDGAVEVERFAARVTAAPVATRAAAHVVILGEKNAPLADGEYALHQGGTTVRGAIGAGGRASLGGVDPGRPFVVEVRDRACAIRAGAWLDPDDPAIQYGGTWFDWSLVRDDRGPDARFWPHYHREMDAAGPGAGGAWTVDRFMQHEHVTRRPIRVAAPFVGTPGRVQISATPVRIRVGPFVRYADHERAVIWLETVTPAMVRVRYRFAGGATESKRHASTVRVGGRYFAAVEIDGLAADAFHDYTVELAPLPAIGPVPVEDGAVAAAFPTLTPAVLAAMKAQCRSVSLASSEWLSFRTLRRTYDRTLRFATGSCRWYPGDTRHDGRSFAPDMLVKLGDWLRASAAHRASAWPHFLFFCGDQIYTDEIGLDHARQLIEGRFASRVPGPADPAAAPRDRLVDGAWSGRFAHRYTRFADPAQKEVVRIQAGIQRLDAIYRAHPEFAEVARDFPDADPDERLRWRYDLFKGKREASGARGEADDERRAHEAVALIPTVAQLETSAAPLRAAVQHWVGASALRHNPMRIGYLAQNYLLWSLPNFEREAPTLADRGPGDVTVVRRPNGRAHPAAERGYHAADFAEIGYLYERAWASSPSVRTLLAHVPTFLMFDDHEVTDDWNFDMAWVRLLHNRRDDFRMWPKTMTDALAAYWMYQGWCNKAPSQWAPDDPRVAALAAARRTGDDALPELRRVIHRACLTPPPPAADPASRKARYQTGTSLDWHYRLPFDPPFLVPDCRSRRLIVESDDDRRVIDHEVPSKAPQSQTIDQKQVEWMRRILVDEWRGGPVAFVATSTPLLMQKKVMAFMQAPEIAASASERGPDLASFGAALLESTKLGIATGALLRVFRRSNDLEHMIRDASWRDLWSIAAAMRARRSPVKTLVLVSGDVHHSYNMTGNLSSRGRESPELLQLTCSGLQTTIRKTFARSLAEEMGSLPFDVGPRRLVPGFVRKRDVGTPDLVLYENAVAIVDVRMGSEVEVVVTYLAGTDDRHVDNHVYRYTSGPGYMKGWVPRVLAEYWARR